MKILLVEDDDLDARVVQRTLGSDDDFRISTRATSLSGALEHLGKETFDAILLDLGLPDTREIESVSMIRDVAPRTAIVVLTGDDDESKATRALSLGAQDYLPKSESSRTILVRTLRYAKERLSIELQLRQKTVELQDSLSRLEAAREQQLALERLQTAAALTHGIAHEFNNSLSVILGNAELLEDLLERLSAPEMASELLSSIIEAAANAGRVSAALGSVFAEPGLQGVVPRLPLGTDLAAVIDRLGGQGVDLQSDAKMMKREDDGHRVPRMSADQAEYDAKSSAVLLVDDEDDVRSILQRLMGSRGLACDSFGDPVEALEAFDPARHAVALVDRAMPGLSGDELTKRLKSICPDLPIIMITGYGSVMKQDDNYPVGVTTVLSKPCSGADLMSALRTACPRILTGN